MASIALMIGGAIINATTFVGGSYLAKYLSGSSDSDEGKNVMISLLKNIKKNMKNMRKIEQNEMIGL